MHNEPLYRVVVDLREEREIFLQRLDQRLPDLEVDGSYLFDAVVENSYGCGPSLCQLTAGLNVHTGGLLTTLLEETWVMVGKAIRIAEQQADTQVKHLYPANWVRTRQTLEGLDMYYTQLAPEDPKRQTQVEGIDPEDQAYLDNVIASEIATEEAVEKAEADLGLAAKAIAQQVQAAHPEAFERLSQMNPEQIEQALEDHLEGVKANWSSAQHTLANLQPSASFSRLLEQERRFTEQYIAEHGIEALPLYRALLPNPELDAKLNEITHPNREMIDRVVREHNARHVPTQSS